MKLFLSLLVVCSVLIACVSSCSKSEFPFRTRNSDVLYAGVNQPIWLGSKNDKNLVVETDKGTITHIKKTSTKSIPIHVLDA